MYDVELSPDLISRVTDGVVEELADWQSRPLDRVYPVLIDTYAEPPCGMRPRSTGCRWPGT